MMAAWAATAFSQPRPSQAAQDRDNWIAWFVAHEERTAEVIAELLAELGYPAADDEVERRDQGTNPVRRHHRGLLGPVPTT